MDWNVTQREAAAEYQHANVFLSSDVQAGFAIVFLEAMAAGKAPVAARSAVVPEVVDHGRLVQPESAESLAAAIETCNGRSGAMIPGNDIVSARVTRTIIDLSREYKGRPHQLPDPRCRFGR